MDWAPVGWVPGADLGFVRAEQEEVNLETRKLGD